MSRTMHRSLLYIFAAVFLACTITSVFAQQSGLPAFLKAGNIKSRKIQWPEYKMHKPVSGAQSGKLGDWVQVSFEYRTKPAWLDELSVTFYILVENETGEPRYRLFSDTFTYVNVAEGRHASFAYLYPSTLKRFGQPVQVDAVIRANYRGRSSEDATTNKEWWKQFSPEAGLILNRMQTPFGNVNFGDLEALKLIGSP